MAPASSADKCNTWKSFMFSVTIARPSNRATASRYESCFFTKSSRSFTATASLPRRLNYSASTGEYISSSSSFNQSALRLKPLRVCLIRNLAVLANECIDLFGVRVVVTLRQHHLVSVHGGDLK